ncbi:MAG: hypothetical protein ACLP66_22210 [Polyangia bacterium]
MRSLPQAVRLDGVDVADVRASCDQMDGCWLAAGLSRRQPPLRAGETDLADAWRGADHG